MLSPRTNPLRLLYWIVTPVFLTLQGWAAAQYFGESTRVTAALLNLGYPLYFLKILGVAKALGILAIATGLSPTLKEWAYAGFTFDVGGAIASQLSVGDSPAMVLVPTAFLVLQLTSYFAWRQLRERKTTRRRDAFRFPARDIESHA